MDKMEHLVKIYGGSMYRNWTNASVALHQLKGFESRLQKAKTRGEGLFGLLNALTEIKIKPLKDGTNIYEMQLKDINVASLATALAKDGINIGRAGKLGINETILYRDTGILFNAFKNAIKTVKV